MSGIDRRIVEMQFDNQQFEKGIQTSVKSLDNLKRGLNLESSVSSLSALGRVANSFSLSGIADGVATLSNRFSTLGVMGMRALQNIADSAYRAGTQMIKALTTDPVKTGFAEYETQINSVQTILANTSDAMKDMGLGEQEQIDLVNAKLDELNEYADKTIYNFTEMTRNIGTFTAAGVDLETSVKAIQGIANLAAVSGSTSQQASTAMYQLSQALSSGTVKLMDWNSVVNAGMGGEVFRNALIRTADTMGVTGEKAREMFTRMQAGEVSFRDSLSSGWLTSEILTETLGQLSLDFEKIAEANDITVEAAKELQKAKLVSQGYTTDEADDIIALAETATDAATKVKTITQLFDTMKEAAQSGWTETWEYIIGDFLEARKLLTSISEYFNEIIGASADSRNAIVKNWRDLGGRNDLIDGFWNVVHAIGNVVSAFKKSFEEFFPPVTAQNLLRITDTFKTLSGRIKAFTEDGEQMGKLQRIFRGVAAVLDSVRIGLGWLWQGFKRLINIAEPAGGSLLDFVASIGDYLVSVRDSIKNSELLQNTMVKIGAVIDSVKGVVTSMGRAIARVFGDIWSKIAGSGILTTLWAKVNEFLGMIPSAIEKLKSWGKGVIDYVKNSQMLQKAWAKVQTFLAPIIEKVTIFAEKFKEAIKAFFSVDTGDSESIGDKLKARFAAFGESFTGWYETAKEKITEAWTNIKNYISTFFSKTMPEFFSSIPGTYGKYFANVGKNLDFGAIVTNALGIAAALKIFSTIGTKGMIGKGLGKIGENLKEIGKGIEDIRKNGIVLKKQDSLAGSMFKIAAAIGILVGSLYLLSKMDDDEIVKGLGVMGILAIELLALSKLFGKVGSNGKSFLLAAAGVVLLVIPVKMLAAMDTEAALKGIAGVGLLLLELGLCMRLASDGLEKKKKTGFLSAAIAINLLVFAVKNLGGMDLESAVKGLSALGVIFIMLNQFMKRTSKVGKTSGLMSMAIAMNLLVFAVRSMGKMDTKTLAKGVLAISAMMLSFGELTKASGGASFKKSLVVLLTLAGSLYMFVEAFKAIDGVDAKSMIAFSASMSAIVLSLSVAIKVLEKVPVGGALTAVANIALAIIGIGALVVGLGALQNEWKDMSGFLKSGGEVLGLIGQAIGAFFGGIAGGFVTGMDLPGIGTELSQFSENVKPFLETAKGIDGTVTTGVKNLAAAFIAIGSAEVSNAISSWIVGENPIIKFSDDLKLIAKALKGYAEEIKGFSNTASSGDISSSVDVADGLASLIAVIPKQNGIAQAINGWVSFTTFKSEIGALADGLKAYGAKMTGFNNTISRTDSDRALTIAKGLASLYTALPETGGSWQKFSGWKSLGNFSEEIVALAGGLKTYAENMTGFSNGISEVDTDFALSVATGLASLYTALPTTGGDLQKLVGWKNIANFSEEIVALSEGLKTYAANMTGFDNGIDKADTERAQSVAEGLASIYSYLPNTGGDWQKFSGWASLTTFADDLKALGAGLKSYGTSVKGFTDLASEDDLTKAESVAKALANLNSALPPTGGSLQNWLGYSDLGGFGDNVAKIGEGLGSFANSVSGVSDENTDNAISSLDKIKEFTDKLDIENGVWNDIVKYFGGSETGTLLEYTGVMKTVGDNLKSFSDNITGVDSDGVGKASDVFESIKTFIGGLETSGGFLAVFGNLLGGSQENTLATAAKSMGEFGDGMKKFTEGASGAEAGLENFDKAKELFNSFIAFDKEVKEGGDIDYSIQMNKLLGMLDDFGSSLGRFGLTLTGVNISDLNTATSIINTLTTLAGAAEGISETGVGNIQTILNDFSTLTIPDFQTSGTDAAGAYIDSLVLGIQNGITSVVVAVTGLSGDGSSAANATYDTWYSSGQYLGSGLANGISSMASRIRNAATNAASGAIRAIRLTWSVHSPSRVGYDLGMNWDLGIAEGIDAYANAISKSSEDVGQGAINSTKAMLGSLSADLAQGLDSTPTIRPVIDLSNVQNGVNTINGLFGANRTLAAGVFTGAAFNRSAASMNFDGARIMNGTNNKDVVNAINDLSERFNHLSEAVAGMRLVLDTGTLVGQIDSKIDKQLGVLAGRRERGN